MLQQNNGQQARCREGGNEVFLGPARVGDERRLIGFCMYFMFLINRILKSKGAWSVAKISTVDPVEIKEILLHATLVTEHKK